MNTTQMLYWAIPLVLLGAFAFRGLASRNAAQPAAAVAALEAGAALVDVRTPGEFASGHLRGALNVPVNELDRRAGELDSTRPVVIYCQGGGRSASAARMLSSRGFEVIDLGPMTAWPRAEDIVR